MKNIKNIVYSFICTSTMLCATEKPELLSSQKNKNIKTVAPGQGNSDKIALTREVETLKRNLVPLSKQEKIAKLEQMRTEATPVGNNPNQTKLNAINVLFAEISKEK